jgi:2-methylisocitrate lyase-like PEP mutase family enzyme
MSLRQLIQRPMPVTAPLVLNPLMARMAEAAAFPAGYLGGVRPATKRSPSRPT